MNGKSQYPVFFKNHAAVTPELVVNRLRRINTYIWLFNKSYSQHKCQFVQKTFGNTGQQQDAIRISERDCTCCRLAFAVAVHSRHATVFPPKKIEFQLWPRKTSV